MGDWNLMAYPDAVPVYLSVILARTERRAAGATFVAIQQGVLALYDDIDRGHVGVGSPSREAIFDSSCHPAACVTTSIAGLRQGLNVHYLDRHKRSYSVAQVLHKMLQRAV